MLKVFRVYNSMVRNTPITSPLRPVSPAAPVESVVQSSGVDVEMDTRPSSMIASLIYSFGIGYIVFKLLTYLDDSTRVGGEASGDASNGCGDCVMRPEVYELMQPLTEKIHSVSTRQEELVEEVRKMNKAIQQSLQQKQPMVVSSEWAEQVESAPSMEE